MRTRVIAVGKMRGPLEPAAAHYEKMLSRYTRIDVVEVADERALVPRVPDGRCRVLLLDREGDAVTSLEFSRLVAEARDAGLELVFLIGGPHGFSPHARPRSDRAIAFGRVTLPHLLARVVLLEQVFRAHRILAGEPYHH